MSDETNDRLHDLYNECEQKDQRIAELGQLLEKAEQERDEARAACAAKDAELTELRAVAEKIEPLTRFVGESPEGLMRRIREIYQLCHSTCEAAEATCEGGG